MAYIKLLKLLYLAERDAMAKWGDSISGDRFVSMPHGPVLSQTYDLIKGHCQNESPWQQAIQDEANYEVSLKDGIQFDDLDELSRAEIRILESVYERFGHMQRFELVDYTHDYCPEWENPNGGSFPIKPESILRAVGKSEEETQRLLDKHREESALEGIRATLR